MMHPDQQLRLLLAANMLDLHEIRFRRAWAQKRGSSDPESDVARLFAESLAAADRLIALGSTTENTP